jgi:hypothetical protein
MFGKYQIFRRQGAKQSNEEKNNTTQHVLETTMRKQTQIA